MNIQIFGTDVSESTIEHARAGIYSSAIEKDISPLRLRRFFTKRDGAYQINRNVRELCTFARQDITADLLAAGLDQLSQRPHLSQPAIAQALDPAVSLCA
jgi:two-component system CheB/CheR fusion protein